MSRSMSSPSVPALSGADLLGVLASCPVHVLEASADVDALLEAGAADASLDSLACAAAGPYSGVLAACAAALDIDCTAAADMAAFVGRGPGSGPAVCLRDLRALLGDADYRVLLDSVERL